MDLITPRQRMTQHLIDNPPPDAGREYLNQDGLLRYLRSCDKHEIARVGEWVKMHYINTDALLIQIRALHRSAKK